MLIAEDLLLLLTDDDTGKLVVPGEHADVALGGAMLVELSLTGRVTVDDRGRLHVEETGLRGDDLLDAVEQVLRSREGKKARSVVGPLSKRLRATLYDRLAARGILRSEAGRVLGVFPTHRWPANDVAHEAQLREDLVRALVQGLTPEPRTASLVGLLQALRATHKVVPPAAHGLTKRDLQQRAKQVAEGDWASAAVRQAIDAANAAVIAAVTAGAAAAGGG
jgi:hypothetical protein